MSHSLGYGTSSGDSDGILRIVCVKIMQEVWRCEGDNVSLHIQKDFSLKGEDYNE